VFGKSALIPEGGVALPGSCYGKARRSRRRCCREPVLNRERTVPEAVLLLPVVLWKSAWYPKRVTVAGRVVVERTRTPEAVLEEPV